MYIELFTEQQKYDESILYFKDYILYRHCNVNIHPNWLLRSERSEPRAVWLNDVSRAHLYPAVYRYKIRV